MLALFLPPALAAQPLVPTLLNSFPDELNEVSGMLVLPEATWVVLDSGNPSALYSIEPGTGNVLRTVTLEGVINTDWEEITTDGTWVYIADVGNNAGARTDLRIHRFPRSLLLDVAVMSVPVETIRFTYSDQVDLTPAFDATAWDCEALVATGDSLFLFTKNWVDLTTHLYALPATPGEHQAMPRGVLDAQGLVTGAALDPVHGTIALIGHDPDELPFVWQLSGYADHAFFSATTLTRRIALPATQVEAIAWSAPDTVRFTCERNTTGAARMWEMPLDLDMGVRGAERPAGPSLHNNPVENTLVVDHLVHPTAYRIMDVRGHTLKKGTLGDGGAVDLSDLPMGTYVIEMVLRDRVQRLSFLHTR
ncbi:MAG: T9SS type A sorting domain-containing protein [Flavobacteriales bacterium]|nr:T9SS type A sorting domain-containing protein [Flavobacteriales bacterium]